LDQHKVFYHAIYKIKRSMHYYQKRRLKERVCEEADGCVNKSILPGGRQVTVRHWTKIKIITASAVHLIV
jgi:hypothetical protein